MLRVFNPSAASAHSQGVGSTRADALVLLDVGRQALNRPKRFSQGISQPYFTTSRLLLAQEQVPEQGQGVVVAGQLSSPAAI